jgi:hypothetical protein
MFCIHMQLFFVSFSRILLSSHFLDFPYNSVLSVHFHADFTLIRESFLASIVRIRVSHFGTCGTSRQQDLYQHTTIDAFILLPI